MDGLNDNGQDADWNVEDGCGAAEEEGMWTDGEHRQEADAPSSASWNFIVIDLF